MRRESGPEPEGSERADAGADREPVAQKQRDREGERQRDDHASVTRRGGGPDLHLLPDRDRDDYTVK